MSVSLLLKVSVYYPMYVGFEPREQSLKNSRAVYQYNTILLSRTANFQFGFILFESILN